MSNLTATGQTNLSNLSTTGTTGLTNLTTLGNTLLTNLTTVGATNLTSVTATGTTNLSNLTVTGTTNLSNLSTTGTTGLTNLMTIGNTLLTNLTTVGTTNLTNVTATGTTNLSNLTATGATNLSNLTVTQATNLQATLDVTGRTTLSDLDVTGTNNTNQTSIMTSNVATNYTIPQLYLVHYTTGNVSFGNTCNTQIMSNNNSLTTRLFYTIPNLDLYRFTITFSAGRVTLCNAINTNIKTYFTISNVYQFNEVEGSCIKPDSKYNITINATDTATTFSYSDIYNLSNFAPTTSYYVINVYMAKDTAAQSNVTLSNYKASFVYEPILSNY